MSEVIQELPQEVQETPQEVEAASIGAEGLPEGAEENQKPSNALIGTIDEQYRSSKTLQNLLSTEDSGDAIRNLAKQVWNQEKLIGGDKIPALKPESSREEKQEWYTSYLGVPETADSYLVPDNIVLGQTEEGEDVLSPLNEDRKEAYKTLAKSSNLTQDQLSSLVENLEQTQANQRSVAAQDLDKNVKKYMSELYAEFGPAYRSTIEAANYGYNQFFPEELRKLMPVNIINHPDFVKAFANHGNNIQDDQAVTTKVDGRTISTPDDAKREIQTLHSSEAWKRLTKRDPDLSVQEKERLVAANERLYKIAYPDNIS
jgi:uncharacterized protein YdbL (DUF1318 family)